MTHDLYGRLLTRYVPLVWVAFAFLAYRNILGVFFVQDDFWFLDAIQASVPNKWMFTGVLPDFFRPIPTYWFPRVNHWLWGLRPFGYHLSQLVIFLLTVYVLYRVLLEQTGSALASSVGTGVYGLSKIHLYTLGWISGASDTLAGLFFVLTIWMVFRYYFSQSRLWMVGGAFLLGLLSKEVVAVLPFAFAGYLLVKSRARAVKERCSLPPNTMKDLLGEKERKLSWLFSVSLVVYILMWAVLTIGANAPEETWGFNPTRTLSVLQNSVVAALPYVQYPAGLSITWFLLPGLVIGLILVFYGMIHPTRDKLSTVIRDGPSDLLVFAILLWVLPAMIYTFTLKPAILQPYYAHFSVFGLSMLVALFINGITRSPKRSPGAGYRISHPVYIILVFFLVYVVLSVKGIVDGIRLAQSPSLYEAQFSSAAYQQLKGFLAEREYQEVIFLDTTDLMWWAVGKGVMIPVMFSGVTARFDQRLGFNAPDGIKTNETVLVLRQVAEKQFEVVR